MTRTRTTLVIGEGEMGEGGLKSVYDYRSLAQHPRIGSARIVWRHGGSPTDRCYICMVRSGESLLLGYGHAVDRYVTYSVGVGCYMQGQEHMM